MDLIKDLKSEDHIIVRPTRTGMYYANQFFRLSSPLDLLKFKPLNFINRIRLGFVVLAVRMVRNWKTLENITAKDWLIKICGKQGYEVVWEPLLKGKFGRYAETVSAVWFWNKLKLRGGSRGEKGKEFLAYYKGGFASLAESMVEAIQNNGGKVELNKAVVHIDAKATITFTDNSTAQADHTVITTPLPIAANLLRSACDGAYINQLEAIQYIGNVCLTLELNKSLSEIYWLSTCLQMKPSTT
jgi:protoporphyrinogen oxidase